METFRNHLMNENPAIIFLASFTAPEVIPVTVNKGYQITPLILGLFRLFDIYPQ